MSVDLDICAICLDPPVAPTCGDSCGHVFCNLCIRRAAASSPACPVCRLPLDGTVRVTRLSSGVEGMLTRSRPFGVYLAVLPAVRAGEIAFLLSTPPADAPAIRQSAPPDFLRSILGGLVHVPSPATAGEATEGAPDSI